MLCEKLGWGWNDEAKHIVVEDSVWDAYLEINPKIKPWRFKGFPLFDDMADLVDGAVATGAGVFHPGKEASANAPSPDWPSQIPDNDDNDPFPLNPALKGAGGRFGPPPVSPGPSPDNNSNSDMDDPDPVLTSSASWKHVCAMSDSPLDPAKCQRSDSHSHNCKPSNGHALMAVSELLEGIATAFQADSTGPASPKQKTDAIKLIAVMPQFMKEERVRIVQLIRADTVIADAFLALGDLDPEYQVNYLRTKLQT
ncbi:hypothetical protein C8R44DRAFT_729661 [Mycena epipterygia]|nr:hypothetical protein C8R44DRAFT_729661 [Mycena epipterygia]